MKMDDVPSELEVKGVRGRRFSSRRYFSGVDNMFVLDVTYRFDIKKLHDADAAKYYPLPEEEEEKSELS